MQEKPVTVVTGFFLVYLVPLFFFKTYTVPKNIDKYRQNPKVYVL